MDRYPSPPSRDLTISCHFPVTSADTDMQARLRPGALLNMLIQSAIRSADHLGFGFWELSKESLFWVLSRMTIEITRPVMWYEDLTVETWPKDIDGLLYLRDFIVLDAKGECVAKAVSAWLAIDTLTKKPRILETITSSMLSELRNKHALNLAPVKIGTFPCTDATDLLTTYFDIDLNRHVTSTRYLDWMMDLIPLEYLLTHYPTAISINYLKETRPGMVVTLSSSHDADQYRFEGIHKESGQVSFRGVLNFTATE